MNTFTKDIIDTTPVGVLPRRLADDSGANLLPSEPRVSLVERVKTFVSGPHERVSPNAYSGAQTAFLRVRG